jgi:hypothetical protein
LAIGSKVTGTQDGYTLQASYGIAPRWQVSLRHDATGNTNELNKQAIKSVLKTLAVTALLSVFMPANFRAYAYKLAKQI